MGVVSKWKQIDRVSFVLRLVFDVIAIVTFVVTSSNSTYSVLFCETDMPKLDADRDHGKLFLSFDQADCDIVIG